MEAPLPVPLPALGSPSRERVAVARRVIADTDRLANMPEDRRRHMTASAWLALRLAREDRPMPDGHSARILRIPRAVFECGARPCKTRLALVPPTTPGDAA